MTASLVIGLVSVIGVGAIQDAPRVRSHQGALARQSPFTAVFQLPAGIPQVTVNGRAPASPGQPRVVCGMTVIPADPKVDPQMPRQVPPEGIQFTMRRVTPTLCWE